MLKNRHIGVTMVEMIIVIAIIAILTALAAPGFREYFEKARLRGAADDVASLLAEARQSAVKQNKQVAVSFGGGAATWCVGAHPAADPGVGASIPNAVACDCTAAAACGIRAISAANYRGVTAVGAAPGTIVFDPKLGTVLGLAANPLTLKSASSRFSLSVVINPIGHARVCRVTGSGVITGYRDC